MVTEEPPFDYLMLLTPGLLLPICSCILGTVFLLFTEPIISDHLISIGVSEDLIGYIFAGSCLSYALASPLVGYLAEKHLFSKDQLTIFAFLITSVALAVQGPSKLLGFTR
jgi:MFS-type transporter involved in bile tolerance (Atg22 family)